MIIEQAFGRYDTFPNKLPTKPIVLLSLLLPPKSAVTMTTTVIMSFMS